VPFRAARDKTISQGKTRVNPGLGNAFLAFGPQGTTPASGGSLALSVIASPGTEAAFFKYVLGRFRIRHWLPVTVET
jgi:hypothetical protein